MTITIFKNIYELETPYHCDIDTALDRIKDCVNIDLINKIRAEKDKDKRNELKKGLKSILFSGRFTNRKKNAVPIEHSGFIILDIDGIQDGEIDNVRTKLISDKYVYACFLSPSGNGFKVLCRIPADTARHGEYYAGLERYFAGNGIELDPSGKNVGRVCYESADPNIYVNKDVDLFKNRIEKIKKEKSVKTGKIEVKADEQVTVDNLLKWWQKNYSYVDGQKHYSIVQLASAFNRYGVSQMTAESVCAEIADNEKSRNLNIGRVKDIYSRYLRDHATVYFEDTTRKNDVVDYLASTDIEDIANDESWQDFTYLEIEELKQEAETEKTGEKKKRADDLRVFWRWNGDKVKIDTEAFFLFLNQLGYYIYYPSPAPDSYFIVKETNRIIKHVDTREIKEEVLAFVKSKKQNVVYDMLSEKTQYFSLKFLNALPVIKPHILRDNEKEVFIPAKRAVYRITAEKVDKIEYIDIDGYVWESQIIEDYEYNTEPNGCDFGRYLHLISGKDDLKTQSLMSIVGYMLNTYKDPAFPKAVFVYDKNISQFDGEPEGGSGKSLLVEAMKYIRDVCPLSGDRVDFSRSFVFQEITESTQIAHIDEYEKNTDFSKFFSRMTGGLPIERKGMQPIFIDYANMPKMIFTGNYKPKGVSGSHRRRRIDFAVEPHFSINHTPVDEFGKRFFSDWSRAEWNDFFTTCIECIRLYLQNGIIEHEDKEDEYLTLITETSREFAEYMILDGQLNKIINDGSIYGRSLYEDFILKKDINSADYSIKKHYICVRKLFKMYSLNYTMRGTGINKEIVIL